MKKLFTLTFLSVFFLIELNAQCTPDYTNTRLGLYPLGDSIPCATQGTAYDQTIQIYSPDSVSIMFGSSPITVHVYSIRIDSISNLPCGLNYGFDRADRTYTTTPTVPLRGCMKISGTTTDPVGEYLLKVSATISTSAASGTFADASTIPGLGSSFKIFFRVKGSSSACAPVDTGAFAPHQTATCKSNDFTNVNMISNPLASFQIIPNPATDQSIVTFTAASNDEYETIITNGIGEVLSHEKMMASAGENEISLATKNLTNGIYFYTIKNGENSMTKKFILSK
jgi:hypothetical protein